MYTWEFLSFFYQSWGHNRPWANNKGGSKGTCWEFECRFFHGLCKHCVWFFGFSCSLEQAFESLVLCVFVQVLELFLRENCGEEWEFGLLFWCAWVFGRNFCGWWLHRIKGECVEWFLPWCNLCIYCWVWWWAHTMLSSFMRAKRRNLLWHKEELVCW